METADSQHDEPDQLNLDPPQVRKKKGLKRSPRACDECRVRKIKCTGLRPCEPCKDFDRRCTYSLNPRRSTDPRQRSRFLQHQLAQIRTRLNEVKQRNRSLTDGELQSLVDALEEDLSAPHGPEIADDIAENATLDSMMSSYGRDASDNPWNTRFYGAPSGLAFLHRTQEFFNSQSPDGSPGSKSPQSAISQLFDAPFPRNYLGDEPAPVESLLPPKDTALSLVTTVFTTSYLVFQIFNEMAFYQMVDRIYDKHVTQFEETDHAFMPLFHIVLGIGYLFSQNEHRNQGCRQANTEAMKHYLMARRLVDISDCRDLPSLQLLLSFVIFLISNARLASAHAFIALACSSSLRLGLHYRSTHHATISQQDRATRRKVFWAVIKLDMYLSAVLGLPAFIDLREVDPAVDLTLEKALREASDGLQARHDISLAISAKHLEVMRLITKAIKTLYPMPAANDENPKTGGNISIRISKLTQIEEEFKVWRDASSEILNKADDGSFEFARLKYELEMSYYFGQIVLYRPFLHYLANMSEGGSVTQQQSQRALICTKIASIVITRSEAMHAQGMLCSASWTSIYTLFLSVVCLTFLIATQSGTNRPIEAYRRAESGIRLLAATACPGMGSVQCLGVLKQLVRRLSHTVDFNIDRIEAETARACFQHPPPNPTFSDPMQGSWAVDTPTGVEREVSSQNSARSWELQEPWQITGSQLHFHGMIPINDADFEGAFNDPSGTPLSSHPYSFGDSFFEISAQPPLQVSLLNLLVLQAIENYDEGKLPIAT
ncbi:uncharacterized protein Z518_02222 [Rhinocladiella mackenziei CBS 650.93]|uniref:Zn(2)-C6 fungal-type domain-containing protein n=1 Tax=Rhinocladiella mackenziei CBS 650.93 TaxID=1442369 RepID=A0A0D2IP22_9EURO|nr:uncharacterized protein Z518_02222 [Rhinocladiella mackenziei CBS 650.93]KIX07569.1 hypothetical protein Z518_02222 [Rhinocladiella mackenziei CBS 650.93]